MSVYAAKKRLLKYLAKDKTKEEGCLCQSCGENYTLDVSVSNSVWEKIKPEGKAQGAGLLCPQCIVDRLVSTPHTYAQGQDEMRNRG